MYNLYRQRCPLGTFPYIIRPGDNFYRLSLRYNTTIPALISANPSVDPNKLTIGQRICIPLQPLFPVCPGGKYYEIKPGDTLYSIASEFNVTVDDILEANPGIDPTYLRVAQIICIPAVVPQPPACPDGTLYTIQSGDTLYNIAREFNVTVDDILEANPGIDPTYLRVAQIICIPEVPQPPACPGGNIYIIKPGDTFYRIARNFNVSLDELLEINPSLDPDRLETGQRICIPLAIPEECPVNSTAYVIKSGDTLGNIATRFNTTVAAIRELNPGLVPEALSIGQKICIPAETAPAPEECPENAILYTVRAGDTLGRLAVRYNTTVAAIRELNPDIRPETLSIGQEICIPLPETREIPVFVEGQTEYREATLERSAQEYFIYVLENFEFTGEEPGRDVLFFTFDDSYFVRIERLQADTELSVIRENAVAELEDLGEVDELEETEIYDSFFRENIFFLTATDEEMTKNIIVKEIDGELFKFTMFLPIGEPSEGVIPSFYSMLKTIRVTR